MDDKSKTIYRVIKNQNYTAISNVPLNDKKLSWRAKGLIAYMITKPNDWKFYLKELVNHSTETFGQLKTAFNELGYNGYIKVNIIYNNKLKRFAGHEILIYESPTDKRKLEFINHINKFKHKNNKVPNVQLTKHIGKTGAIPNTDLKEHVAGSFNVLSS